VCSMYVLEINSYYLVIYLYQMVVVVGWYVVPGYSPNCKTSVPVYLPGRSRSRRYPYPGTTCTTRV